MVEGHIPLTSTKRFAFAIMLHVHAFHVLKEIFILKVTRSWIEQGKKEFKRKGDEDSRLKRKFRLKQQVPPLEIIEIKKKHTLCYLFLFLNNFFVE